LKPFNKCIVAHKKGRIVITAPLFWEQSISILTISMIRNFDRNEKKMNTFKKYITKENSQCE
jgi:hypothetical protein